ncbi:MAG: UDP-N-acetylmuramoyl-L-alanine--D-glutamate ligase [Pyrinomonadaceae bacterium]
MRIADKKALVLGAGRSGIAATRFLAARGATVALHDKRAIAEWSVEARELRNVDNVGLVDGELPSWLLDQIELVVISPGVPTSTIPARYVDRKNGEVIGEVELAFRFLKGKIVGITGSNGKTTTTALIGELLKNAGFHTQIGGNIGTPLLDLTETSAADGWTVAELSSFQLETIKDFRPSVAICLNVTPNHLDRYDAFIDYATAKHRLFMNQGVDDVAILNADDEITASWASGLKAKVVMFSVRKELEEGLFLRREQLIWRTDGEERVLSTRNEIFLRGLHNIENILAAFAAGLACGASPGLMRDTVSRFKGVEHRIEFVAEIAGVKFYNDSKATSVDATCKSLEAVAGSGKTNLILGGRGKGAPYTPLADLIKSTVRNLIVIGEDADNIESQLAPHAAIIRAESLNDAVGEAFAVSEKGDTVLLAPACASFDMFSGYEERGEVFKNSVKELAAQVG